MAAHPDRGGSDEMAAMINEAFGALDQHRFWYDRWLGPASGEFSEPGASDRRAEHRRDDLKFMVDEIQKAFERTAAQDDVLSPAQLGRAASFTLIYNQRFLPSASFAAEDLMDLIQNYSLGEDAHQKWERRTLLALAYGAIEVMRERAKYGDIDQRFARELRKLRGVLEDIIRQGHPNGRRELMADSIYIFLEGHSFLARFQAETQAQRRTPASCASTMTTTLRVRDENGVEWVVPITISVGLGP